jgi:sigma-E factor negative regulatory protein RseA
MNAPRHPEPVDHPQAGERLSSFVDGEGRPDDVEDACRRWKADETFRRDWATYHLIGDVLRSEELSPARPGDAAFLQGLRARLASEPVPLAPAPLPPPPVAAARLRRWLAPAAMAAGVMAVGTAFMVMRADVTGPAVGWGSQVAATPPADLRRAGALTRPVAAPASAQGVMVLDGQVIRDARLDAYFEAHRGAVGPVPSAMPGGALRSVDILVPQR